MPNVRLKTSSGHDSSREEYHYLTAKVPVAAKQAEAREWKGVLSILLARERLPDLRVLESSLHPEV